MFQTIGAGMSGAEKASLLMRYWPGRTGFHAEMLASDLTWVDKKTQKPGMMPRGSWLGRRHGDLTQPMLQKHVAGLATFGRYQINANDQVHWLMGDLEWRGAEELEVSIRFLERFGIKGVIEESSEGRFHHWILLDKPLSAKVAFQFGLHYKHNIFKAFEDEIRGAWYAEDPAQNALLRDLTLRNLANREFFPKQPERGSDGFGNLARLPFSYHQKKNMWSKFHSTVLTTNNPLRIEMATARLDLECPDPVEAMRPKSVLNIVDRPKSRMSSGRRTDLIQRIEQVDASISIQQVVAEAWHLPMMRPGDKVVCQFHDKGSGAGSSGAPAFQVGGRIAKDVAWCWSANCPLWMKKLTRLNFMRSHMGTEDYFVALEELERMAGILR
jgi:hypothetical protein